MNFGWDIKGKYWYDENTGGRVSNIKNEIVKAFKRNIEELKSKTSGYEGWDNSDINLVIKYLQTLITKVSGI